VVQLRLLTTAPQGAALRSAFTPVPGRRYAATKPATFGSPGGCSTSPDQLGAAGGDDPFVLNDSTITISFAVPAEGSISIGVNGSLSDELTHTLAISLVPAQAFQAGRRR
jgi:hypothetical protein